MRWLLGGLAVANLLFFVWHMLLPAANGTGELQAAGVGSLRLLSETGRPVAVPSRTSESTSLSAKPAPSPLSKATQTAVPRSNADPVITALSPPPVVAVEVQESKPEPVRTPKKLAKSVRCTRLGPYDTREARQAAQAAILQARVDSALPVQTTETKVSGYYVLLPPAASLDAGKGAVEKLKAAGIKDVWLFRSGELRHAVSLGMFSSRRNAQVQATKIKRKGFPVELRERSKAVDLYWLDVRHGSGVDPAGLGGGQPRTQGAKCDMERA